MTTFREHREEFFKDCDFVIKAPGSFFWGGEHSIIYGHLAIVQPLPKYFWVGKQRGSFDRFSFEFKIINDNLNLGQLGTNLDAMQVENLHEIMEDLPPGAWQEHERILQYLNYWKEKCSGDFFGIKSWCELPPKCGLNSSGAFGSCLAIILHILERNLDPACFNTTLETWQSTGLPTLKDDKDFLEIYQTSWILEDCCHNYSSSGGGAIFPLISGKDTDLLLYFTEAKGFGARHPVERNFDFNYQVLIDKIRSINFFATQV